jgi:hypothetical protein
MIATSSGRPVCWMEQMHGAQRVHLCPKAGTRDVGEIVGDRGLRLQRMARSGHAHVDQSVHGVSLSEGGR